MSYTESVYLAIYSKLRRDDYISLFRTVITTPADAVSLGFSIYYTMRGNSCKM